MAGTVTLERLRELARFRADRGCAVTLYLDLDPSTAATAGDAATRINSLVTEGERTPVATTADLAHEQRQGVRDDFARIRSYFESDFDRDGAHGLAIFAAGLDGVWATLPLAERVADTVTIARRFYLAPLVPLIGRGEGALVAIVNRERGQVFHLRGGRLEEVADHSEQQPRRHDQGGWSQARYQRHIDNLALEHMRTVADEIDRQVRRLHDVGLVVICAEEARAEFGEMLSQESRAALAGWTQAEAHAPAADLLEIATPVLEQWRAQREAALLERWREEAGRNSRAAGGWAETLEAASDGRVELLLFQEGVDRDAWECPACGRASARDASCPLDGTRMEPQETGLDLAVHQTLAHGGRAWAVRHHQDLDPVDGIGALLRY